VTALQKAQAAIDRAKSLIEEHGHDMPAMVERQYCELLGIAGTQAAIAQAVALERMANIAERIAVCFEAREEA
jgi:hypothetical protein